MFVARMISRQGSYEVLSRYFAEKRLQLMQNLAPTTAADA
jgi:hypothetical protein